jgi:hypothetical protein
VNKVPTGSIERCGGSFFFLFYIGIGIWRVTTYKAWLLFSSS